MVGTTKLDLCAKERQRRLTLEKEKKREWGQVTEECTASAKETETSSSSYV